jgi:gamma-glutamylcyclotransferase (GGCT)/AIG2-like uncharacterized protein YtfP
MTGASSALRCATMKPPVDDPHARPVVARVKTPDTFEVERTTGSHEILDRLFVYGTLRTGQTARSLMANSVRRSEPAKARGQLYAFPMGHPGFVEGEGEVTGEMCWLGDLAATFALLDAYEGVDFTRVIRKVRLNSGAELWAWVYVLTDSTAVRLGEHITDGDWVRHWSAQLE